MRLPRSGLVERLLRPGAAPVILLEAPSGFGKSWLLRQAWGSDALKWRATLGALAGAAFEQAGKVVIDDAHLLSDEEVEYLVDHLEFTDGRVPFLIAGRLLDDRLHQVTELIDGVSLDHPALAVTAGEVAELLPNHSADVAAQIVDAADGETRVVAATLTQLLRQPNENAVSFTSRVVRANAVAASDQLRTPDDAVVGVLARCPGLGRHLLENLAGRGVVHRLIEAGIPLRRHPAEGLELGNGSVYASFPVDAMAASRFAGELAHDRPFEAVGLLLDAGEHAQASRILTSLSESVIGTMDPRALLSLLSRFGSAVERTPGLLLIRSGAAGAVGQTSQAMRDVDRAVELADSVSPALRRRIIVESARARLVEGEHDRAVRAAQAALTDIGPGEDRTYARAHEVLAECAASSDTVRQLQQAAESFRVAAAAWEACGEHVRARSCRRSLAMGVLVALGRFDQALSQLATVVDAVDQSDGERAISVLSEGFVLVAAGRLDSALDRFSRAKEIGLLLDNPRLIAAAAWGCADVARRRGDRELTLRQIAEAENTAMQDSGGTLGLPFLCDVTEMLGSLGELDLAERYLQRAMDSAALFPDTVATTRYIHEARRGHLGDLRAQLERTAPVQRWRVLLVTAHALARAGDLDQARQLFGESERELVGMGRASAADLGEAREFEAAHRLLEGAAVVPEIDEPAIVAPSVGDRPAVTGTHPSGRLIKVFGSPMTVRDATGETSLPSGNPQRLVGVVVAAGGSATFDHIGEAMWPDDGVGTSRTRLRNVLMRLRRAVGDILVRTEIGVRMAADVSCDLHEFDRAALDAISSTRADPEMAGRLATRAVQLATGAALADFEYEEWAITARRAAEQRLISLLDLLSIQAEDDGDLPRSQAMAERALQLDRYTDSRYVRLAELLVLQDRNAAAIAVLDDAASVARGLGDDQPGRALDDRRREILRRTASGG